MLRRLLLTALFGILLPQTFASPKPVKVEVKRVEGGWQLLRDGKPYYIYGAGGRGNTDLLKQLGGNSVRTWGSSSQEMDPVLADAHRLGLTVAAGLGLEHERHGFNYSDAARVKQQYEQAIAAVERYKNDPAILVWGIGNEMEAAGDNPQVWTAVNDIAREIHRIDPNHPTMTVIAGVGRKGSKLINFMKYCPDVDILGINSYGAMKTLLEDVRGAKLDRPYIVTEFGPVGWWERPKTDWGAPLEQTSTEKAATYRHAYEHSVKGAGNLCFGSYAFAWASKQERTHTWFGLLVPDAKGNTEKTDVVDVLSYEWTGKWPANRSPQIASIVTKAALQEVAPGSEWEASVKSTDPDSDALIYEWEVREETHDAREGGDAEAVPPSHPEALSVVNGANVKFRAPQQSGAYRLFVAVHDGHGGVATANVPFFVKQK
jgi:hypothetical protein